MVCWPVFAERVRCHRGHSRDSRTPIPYWGEASRLQLAFAQDTSHTQCSMKNAPGSSWEGDGQHEDAAPAPTTARAGSVRSRKREGEIAEGGGVRAKRKRWGKRNGGPTLNLAPVSNMPPRTHPQTMKPCRRVSCSIWRNGEELLPFLSFFLFLWLLFESCALVTPLRFRRRVPGPWRSSWTLWDERRTTHEMNDEERR